MAACEPSEGVLREGRWYRQEGWCQTRKGTAEALGRLGAAGWRHEGPARVALETERAGVGVVVL